MSRQKFLTESGQKNLKASGPLCPSNSHHLYHLFDLSRNASLPSSSEIVRRTRCIFLFFFFFFPRDVSSQNFAPVTEQPTVTVITSLPLVLRKKTKAKNCRLNASLPMTLSSTISIFWPNRFHKRRRRVGGRDSKEPPGTFQSAEHVCRGGVQLAALRTIHSKCRLLNANYTSKKPLSE